MLLTIGLIAVVVLVLVAVLATALPRWRKPAAASESPHTTDTEQARRPPAVARPTDARPTDVRLTHARPTDARPTDVRAPAPNAAPETTEVSGADAAAAERAGVRPAPLPVVLVHGLFGFDRIGVPGARFDYFRGIAAHLKELGCEARAVRLPASASVPDRARELVAAIEALPHERIDLIAHSLGGLDARYALTHLGLAQRVRSLVTVGTPHRGTPLADLVLRGPLNHARRVMRALGLPMEALEWLGTDALAAFNRQVVDAAGVRYACVVGGLHGDDRAIPLALVPAHAYLRRVAGPNDGLVPVASQYWGETLAEIEADHFAQIGWRVTARHTFDAASLYAFVVARLGDAPSSTAAARPTA